ncbi:MAG: hypothetical protein PF636_03350 [Actinomycetota bacterium]|jgi:hypothetical protein|nr:hypothetical protein [Actinomycetota bacterium]
MRTRKPILIISVLAAVIVLGTAAPAWATPKFDTIEDAVAYIKQLSAEGRSRAEIAAEVTEIVDNRVTNVNSWERVLKWPNMLPFGSSFNTDEDDFDKFREQKNSFDNDVAADWVWNSRYGQCEECGCLSYYLLQQAEVEGNVRIYSSAEGASTHDFVVWGLEEGADPNDPSTWGDDAYAVDGWQGVTLDREGAAANKHMFNNGEANIADRTRAHDDSAPVWQTDSSSAGSGFGDDCLMELLFGEAPGGEKVLEFARNFRDEALTQSAAGRAVIATYYTVSPRAVQVVNAAR